MTENENSMLALQLAILEKLEDQNSIIQIERENDTLVVKNKAGKINVIDIPLPKDGKDADNELIQNNVLEHVITHVDTQLKDIEIKSLTNVNDRFRHDQDNILTVIDDKISNVENKLTSNIEIIHSNLDATKLDLTTDINKKLDKVRLDIEEIKAIKVRDGLNGVDGKNGKNGKDGNGILDAKIDQRGHLILVTNDKTYDLGSVRRKGGVTIGGGGTGDFTYTNSLSMPQDVGGLLAGTTFKKMTLNELWTRLLYPYQFPEFTSFTIDLDANYEVGNTIEAGNYDATWNISNVEMLESNSIAIKYANTNTFLASNLPDEVPYSLAIPEITFNIPTNVMFTISALNTTETTFTRNFSINFMQRIYIGESNLDTLTEIDVKELRLSELKSNINGEYEMLTGGYKWFCYPTAMGTRSNFVDLDTSFPIAMNTPQTISITNDFGVTANYYCYRTFNMLGGAINVGIS